MAVRSSLFQDWQSRARAALDQKTKPPGSLGKLEDIAARLAGIQRTLSPSITRPHILVFAADHGIAEEGVSAYPQKVTAQMMANFESGGAAINVLTRAANIELTVVDAGVGAPTANFLRAPALTESELETALRLGRETAKEAIRDGADLIGVGEMGIGNTTAAAALTTAMLAVDPKEVTGRGTGIDDETLAHKTGIVRRALAQHRDAETAVDWLRRVGGKEIAAMVGAVMECADSNIATVIDGFIATSAAAVAIAELPSASETCLFAHRSRECGHALLLAQLGADPILDLGMRLGEATGAALAIPIIRSAARVLTEMATFDSAEISGSSGDCP